MTEAPNALALSHASDAVSARAQRLSATLMNALHEPPGGVLNASRDIGRLAGSRELACSTPFGDIDECTRSRTGAAQAELRVMCSTPFGDIDECTESGPGPNRLAEMLLVVLNAFRRH